MSGTLGLAVLLSVPTFWELLCCRVTWGVIRQADWGMLTGKEGDVVKGGSDKYLHSPCYMPV